MIKNLLFNDVNNNLLINNNKENKKLKLIKFNSNKNIFLFFINTITKKINDKLF